MMASGLCSHLNGNFTVLTFGPHTVLLQCVTVPLWCLFIAAAPGWFIHSWPLSFNYVLVGVCTSPDVSNWQFVPS